MLALILMAVIGWSSGYIQEGQASYYADKFYGRPMACGGIFRADSQIAAHRTLKCGTKIRVTNIENGTPGFGTSIILTVKDRGPFVKGRILDITHRNMRKLAGKERGRLKIRIEELRDGES